VNNFLPQQVVVGGSWKLLSSLRVNADFTWVNWSAYVPPVADVQVQAQHPAPQGGWPLGIAPPTTPAPTVIIPIQMHDTVVPHVGLEWRAVSLPKCRRSCGRGNEYDKTPIPAQTGATNYIDRDRHAVSFALGSARWTSSPSSRAIFASTVTCS